MKTVQENVHIFKAVDFQEIDSIITSETDIKGLKPMATQEIHSKQLELVK